MEKLACIKKEMRDIQLGIHPDFVSSLEDFRKERDYSIFKAELWRDYELECTEALYVAEMKQADEDYEVMN